MISTTLLGIIVMLAAAGLGWWWIIVSENKLVNDFIGVTIFLLLGVYITFFRNGSIPLGAVLFVSIVILLIAVTLWLFFSRSWSRPYELITGFLMNSILFAVFMIIVTCGAMAIKALAKLL